jgi:hypothetical protein
MLSARQIAVDGVGYGPRPLAMLGLVPFDLPIDLPTDQPPTLVRVTPGAGSAVVGQLRTGGYARVTLVEETQLFSSLGVQAPISLHLGGRLPASIPATQLLTVRARVPGAPLTGCARYNVPAVAAALCVGTVVSPLLVQWTRATSTVASTDTTPLIWLTLFVR